MASLDTACLLLNAELLDELTAISSIYGKDVQISEKIENSMNDESRNSDLVNVLASICPKIEHNDGHIMVEVYLSSVGSDADSVVPDEIVKVGPANFQRTVSGRRLTVKFEVQAVPSVHLSMVISSSYPAVCPEYSLRADWLTSHQLDAMKVKLLELFQESQGAPILHVWFNWLECDALSYLGVDSTLVLACSGNGDFDDQHVHRALFAVLEADLQHMRLQFELGMHECPVCCDTKPGVEFYFLDECQHFFCKLCADAYLDMHVKQGTVQYIRCLDQKCEFSFPPSLIRQILGAEAYERWDRLTLQRALDSMTDVDYCPRCKSVVFKESDHETSRLASCDQCLFAFCTMCRDPWHPLVDCETIEERLAKLEGMHLPPAERQLAHNKLANASRQLIKQQIKQNLMSAMTIKKQTKSCPKCRSPIEKDGGCDSVRCARCFQYMCWLCGSAVEPIGHIGDCSDHRTMVPSPFQDPSSRAQLRYTATVNADYLSLQTVLSGNEQARRLVKRCVCCGQPNLKSENNNHMRCWCCNTQFCYLCLKRIDKAKEHYKAPNKCLQHTAD